MADRASETKRFDLTDRLNPILLRELQQTVRSKGFMAVVGLALLAILTVALSFAALPPHDRPVGFEAFQTSLAILAPALVLFIPINAFLSMRQEVAGGSEELLMLSRLRPIAIALGKLQSSLVMIAISLALFGPLIAMTFFLRGVSVADIAMVLLLGLEISLLGASIGIALGALCRYRVVSSLPYALSGLGFASATIMIIAFIFQELDRFLRDVDAWEFHVSFSGVCLFGIALSMCLAAAALTHPFENRSTPLRSLAAGGAVSAFLLPPLLGFTASVRDDLDMCMVVLGCLAPFFLFSTSEEDGFSPRTRLQVPRSSLLAAISLPFLPGGGRGMIFSLGLIAFCLGAGLGIPILEGLLAFPGYERAVLTVEAFALWSVVFAGGSSLFRTLLPSGAKWSGIVRVLWPLAFGLFHVLLPSFMSAMGYRWFFSYDGECEMFYVRAGAFAAAFLLLANLRRMGRGITETMRCSRARRAARRTPEGEATDAA